ncbi:hypothetical protein EYF80_030579 [Liparis tanakae]|uniref:Uncharacterized protein n=1 Tax=Liparis tanakae TaxID=230148 RepID=A0A4Z2H0C1_9TELE|nr:hypothetical protein EYF80_030579 [Liparis tanakae]
MSEATCSSASTSGSIMSRAFCLSPGRFLLRSQNTRHAKSGGMSTERAATRQRSNTHGENLYPSMWDTRKLHLHFICEPPGARQRLKPISRRALQPERSVWRPSLDFRPCVHHGRFVIISGLAVQHRLGTEN